MLQYFLNNVDIYNASDDAYIVVLAFFAFGNVYVEDPFLLAGHRTLCPTHASSVIRLVSLAIFFICKFRAILASLGSGDLRTKVAVRCKNAKKTGEIKPWWWN